MRSAGRVIYDFFLDFFRR